MLSHEARQIWFELFLIEARLANSMKWGFVSHEYDVFGSLAMKINIRGLFSHEN